ncbi:NAD(P)-binding domain-containing protein [Acuticoccus kandeliae]|uniref:NAD(P)-binding domain-containing protein n=1 Tax=Acuticoccus kandeliae TaxID=2073160 RepID=UPI000D3E4D33|nr:NAD(P)-binding domain-containing protein [Acuticoccus kandeliae]
MPELSDLPVAIIGAGPVGLAAAAHVMERGMAARVLERGADAGAAVRDWGHVRLFSPWRFNVDDAARRLLETTGWTAPDPDRLPTGAELLADYLAPLARHPHLARAITYGATVTGITREGLDKSGSTDRAEAPFLVRWRDASGATRTERARAVIDASGTWGTPNPMGTDGLPVPGEAAAAALIDTGIPDILGARRADFAGRRVLVVGSGHSAINAVLDLIRQKADAPGTMILWALRHDRLARLFGGGADDQLAARGALGIAAREAVEAGDVRLLAPFAATAIHASGDGLTIEATHQGAPMTLAVDRAIVATGFRPDLALLREVRVGLDPVVEAPSALAPLIDPNLHSCGTVPPHGAAELAHPEPGLFIAGAKSYGRAPTFLMATGYEQVRSIAAHLAGDEVAARAVHLVLPQTGVCSSDLVEEGCCAPVEAAEREACCGADLAAKRAGAAGCGCGAPLDMDRIDA